MLILNVRAKIWDFFNVRTQKWVLPKCHWNAILILFEYINLVKFSKNLQNFIKRRLRQRFGRFAPEHPKILQCNPPRAEILQSKPPLRGSETPLYLVLGRQKGLGRGLMHPWSVPFWTSKNENSKVSNWRGWGLKSFSHKGRIDCKISARGVRLQGFRIFGREAPETAPKAPF